MNTASPAEFWTSQQPKHSEPPPGGSSPYNVVEGPGAFGVQTGGVTVAVVVDAVIARARARAAGHLTIRRDLECAARAGCPGCRSVRCAAARVATSLIQLHVPVEAVESRALRAA